MEQNKAVEITTAPDVRTYIRKLAEEAAESAHSLGMEPADAPSADLAYEFMCDNVWNDNGESDPVDPLSKSDMPAFRMWYRMHMLALDQSAKKGAV